MVVAELLLRKVMPMKFLAVTSERRVSMSDYELAVIILMSIQLLINLFKNAN